MIAKQLVVVSSVSILACLVVALTGASTASCSIGCADDCGSGGFAGTGGSGGVAGGSAAGGGAAGGPGGGGHQMVNGCDAATAVDKRAEVMVQITFSGTAYDPPCLRVLEGTSVTLSGDFGQHPLVAGRVLAGMPNFDTASPIPKTSTGMSAVATFPKVGDYGFYCSSHYSSGMMGAVYVDAPRPPTSR